jgi:serine/threonine protein phosphatase 1
MASERTLVIGDIHGAYNALIQCLERSGFDRGYDRLIVMGDVCDGYPDVRLCIDELLAIKHCDYIIGNHDLWALEWAKNGTEKSVWLNQGGENTIVSYGGGAMPRVHVEFLKAAHPWIVHDGTVFVHGGIDPNKNMDDQDTELLVWDRTLVADAWNQAQKNPEYKFSNYKEIFVGHTPTQHFTRKQMFSAFMPGLKVDSGDKPLFLCNVIMLDTGAGWSGKLTIMDVNTHEYWQSDPTPKLYELQGRR